MFSELVVAYLFFAGAGAGLCFILAIVGLLVPGAYLVSEIRSRILAPKAYEALFAPAFALSILFMLLGVVFLAADLGRVDRLLLFVTQPRFSHITVGAYAVVACVLLAFALMLVWRRAWMPTLPAFRILQVLLAGSAVVVMVYTGLFLSSMHSVPLWSTPWLTVLFFASSASCGIAVLLLVLSLSPGGRRFHSLAGRLARLDIACVALDVVALAFVVVGAIDVISSVLVPVQGTAEDVLLQALGQLTNTDLALVESFAVLVFGEQSLMFWVALVLVGLLVPLAIDVVCVFARRQHRTLVIAASLCVLAGGYALRHCIVSAGVQPALIAAGVM